MSSELTTVLVALAFIALLMYAWTRLFYSQTCFRRITRRIRELEALVAELQHLEKEVILPDDFRHDAVIQLANAREELKNSRHIRDWLLELHPDYCYLDRS